MRILANTKNMPRGEWLAWRKKGIGGSDAGAICGFNPYRSAIQVFADKIGEDISEVDNEAVRVGHDLEDYVARRFMEATGKKVHRRNALMQHDEYDFMLANVDRMVVGENALLECKTANAYAADKWTDGKCPESYEVQCHHYMAVTGAEKVYLACLIMGIDFVVVEIERNETVIEDLIKLERDFWENYVLKKQMPPPDGSKASDDAIKEIYTAVREGVIELPDCKKKLERIDELDDLIDEKSVEREKLKQEIKVEMNEFETAFIGDRKVTWKLQKGRITVDSKRLKAEKPDIYEEYSKAGSPVRVFRLSKKAEA